MYEINIIPEKHNENSLVGLSSVLFLKPSKLFMKEIMEVFGSSNGSFRIYRW